MRTLLALIALTLPALAEGRFVGWQSCATSGCHGGGKGADQVLTWKKQDHHAGAYGILISERSQRMAEALGIGEAAKSNQCTVCHSPMHAAAADRLTPSLKQPNLGVSCEACHNPGEEWLRFHTRTDITHAQRVAAGMRDLSTAYRRANSCAGCHANLPTELHKAGHPIPRFELARQLAELPPHWRDFEPSQSGGAWLTSQAALLRELCWMADKGQPQTDRIDALHWILRGTRLGSELLPGETAPVPLRAAADRLAKAASANCWETKQTRAEFERLAGLASQVRDADAPVAFARAEVLTAALQAMILGLAPKVTERAKIALGPLNEALRSSAIFDVKRYTELVAELVSAVQATP